MKVWPWWNILTLSTVHIQQVENWQPTFLNWQLEECLFTLRCLKTSARGEECRMWTSCLSDLSTKFFPRSKNLLAVVNILSTLFDLHLFSSETSSPALLYRIKMKDISYNTKLTQVDVLLTPWQTLSVPFQIVSILCPKDQFPTLLLRQWL